MFIEKTKKAILMLDENQRIRLNRTLLACISYFLAYLLVFLYEVWGIYLLDLKQTLTLFALSSSINLTFLWLIVSGKNLKFKDPSLTIPQIITAVIFIYIVYYYSSGYRGSFLVFYVFAFTFGFFKLRGRQFLSLSGFVFLGHCIMLFCMYKNHPEYFDLKHDTLRALVLLTTLIWFSILGSHQYHLRVKLAKSLNELKQLNIKLVELATTDELTGLYNRREMLRRLNEEYRKSKRYGTTLSVVMADIDHFKSVNDTFGHEMGDLVLKRVAHMLKATIRDVDCVGRFGGEEFLVLLPNTSLEGASVWAERARKDLERYEFNELSGRKITLSLGVAELKHGEDLSSLLRRADEALYLAKDKGRNRVEKADGT